MCEHGNFGKVIVASGVVDVDKCIVGLVQWLNDGGYKTVACCCGHGNRPGNIALKDGRELIIAKDFKEGRLIDSFFPLDIHGFNDGEGE